MSSTYKLGPMSRMLQNILNAVQHVTNKFKPACNLEESVSQIIESHESDNPIEIQEKNVIRNLFEFRDLKVNEVMIPRTDIAAVHEDLSYQELKQKFIETRHTRLPIYTSNLDEITGFIHLKDFIDCIEDHSDFYTKNLKRKLIYVPRSMKCIDLLDEMRKNATNIAVILDEYGGTEGIVTIENLIEEIVGDIKDEHDKEIQIGLTKLADDSYEVDGRVSIEALEKELNIEISGEEEYETINGFILAYLGRIPKYGEKINHPIGLNIEILDANERKIKKLLLVARSNDINDSLIQHQK